MRLYWIHCCRIRKQHHQAKTIEGDRYALLLDPGQDPSRPVPCLLGPWYHQYRRLSHKTSLADSSPPHEKHVLTPTCYAPPHHRTASKGDKGFCTKKVHAEKLQKGCPDSLEGQTLAFWSQTTLVLVPLWCFCLMVLFVNPTAVVLST
jgi:hypothetical protein